MKEKVLKKFIIVCIFFGAIYFFNITDSNASNEQEELPQFYGTTNIIIKMGDTLDIKKSYYRIFARDNIDGNITKNIQVVENNVNTNVEGNYTIKYKVSNSRGKVANIAVPVQVIKSGERKIQRTMYVLPDSSHLDKSNFYRGNMQDTQNLGFYLPAGVTVKAKQINKECKDTIYISFYNDDSLTESSGTRAIYNVIDGYDVIGYDTRKELTVQDDNYVDLKNITNIKRKQKEAEDKEENWQVWNTYNEKTYDSVPMAKTKYGIKENPIIEIVLNDNIKELDYFTYGDNEQNFKNNWKNSKNKFAVLDGDRAQLLVPYKDLEELAVSKKGKDNNYRHDNFTSIESILKYYDNIVETYDEWIGLSYDAKEWYNKNIKTKFFIKCNIHGAGGAAYAFWDYTYMTSDSLDVFLHCEGDGWAPLHEIGHGYQGRLQYLGDLYLGEVSNNFLAYYYQKNNLDNEDWLSEYNGNEIMNLVRSTDKSYLKEYNNPSTDEGRTGINEFKLKLFAYINLFNKIGAKEAISSAYSYCRYLVCTNQIEGKTATDIIAKGFSEGTEYNVIPYLEDWKLDISDYTKRDVYIKDYPIVYYLKDLVSSDSEAKSIKQKLNLQWEYSLVENNELAEYQYTGNLKVSLSEEQFNILKGNKLILKSGNNIVKNVNIDNCTVIINNVPIGAYEIESDNRVYSIIDGYTCISKGKTDLKTINIVKRKLINLIIKTPPLKTEYYEGENFDTAGMKIEAIYNNYISEEIEDYYIFNDTNLRLTQKNVRITYTEDGITKTVNQEIKVIKKEELKIKINKFSIAEDRYIENINAGTTLNMLRNDIETNGNLSIYKDDKEITNENELIATGMKLVIKLHDEEVSYTIVVTGDLFGDGVIDSIDLLKLARYNLKIDLNLKDAYLRATDIYKDGTFGDIKDILKLSRKLAKIE